MTGVAGRDIARRAARAAGLPEDVLGMPRLVLRGDRELMLENHKGIVEYAPERLRVRTELGVMAVEGEGLTLASLGECDLLISGLIRLIRL